MGGLVDNLAAAAARPATPKIAFFSPPADYIASDGKRVNGQSLDIVARIVSIGKVHHAMTGTGAIAIAAASAIPGTIVEQMLGGARSEVCLGHPSGKLKVGADTVQDATGWRVTKAIMSRTAR